MIDTKNFDTYQLEQYNAKQTLMLELKKVGVESRNLWIVEGDNGRADFRLILQGENRQYEVSRDYKGIVTIHSTPYMRFDRVDNYKASELRKAIYLSQNMKVITLKKLNEKIAEEELYILRMTELNNENENKVADFLKAIKASGEKVTYTYSDYYTDTPKKINGGYIERNGLSYHFEISDSGYISQKITTDYRDTTSLEVFKKLADNKY